MSEVELSMGEGELRALCARLLAGAGDVADGELLRAEPAVAAEAAARLGRCGVTLVKGEQQAPLCVVDEQEELSELALACLALCVIVLGESHGARRRRTRLDVRVLWERVGKGHGYSESYVRRAGLGPLETRGLLRVVRPEQRAAAAYVVAGPGLRAIDRDAVATRLRALTAAA